MKTILLATHLLPLNFDLQTPHADSPNALLYGLLGLMLIGVIQVVYVFIKMQQETTSQSIKASNAPLSISSL